MTDRAGCYMGETTANYRSATAGSFRYYDAAVYVNALTIGSAPPKYKNQGWYAAGAVWEVWVTTPLPSNFPPSGHTLTEVTYVELQE